jgi:adenosylhomocysteine nucleosidase
MASLGMIVAMKAEAPVLPEEAGAGIVVLVSGIGQRKAAAAARRLLLEHAGRVGCLISWGLCGAVAGGLQVGDLFVADMAGRRSERCDLRGPWLDELLRLARPLDCHVGLLQTCDRPVFTRRGLLPDAAAVDMEAFAVAQVARSAGIPMLAVKAVSDVVPLSAGPANLWSWYRNLRAGMPVALASLNTLAAQWITAIAPK